MILAWVPIKLGKHNVRPSIFTYVPHVVRVDSNKTTFFLVEFVHLRLPYLRESTAIEMHVINVLFDSCCFNFVQT